MSPSISRTLRACAPVNWYGSRSRSRSRPSPASARPRRRRVSARTIDSASWLANTSS